MEAITVYTKPACMQCNATFRALDHAEIAYTKIDITQDRTARDYVLSLGYLSLPVVYVSPALHWSGFRPEKLRSLSAA
ncbi:MAG TPA: glutaredoxin-like protein NrdH [Mycobacterium sp.]